MPSSQALKALPRAGVTALNTTDATLFGLVGSQNCISRSLNLEPGALRITIDQASVPSHLQTSQTVIALWVRICGRGFVNGTSNPSPNLFVKVSTRHLCKSFTQLWLPCLQTVVSMHVSWCGKPNRLEVRNFPLFIHQNLSQLFMRSLSVFVLFCFHPLCVFVVGNHELHMADRQLQISLKNHPQQHCIMPSPGLLCWFVSACVCACVCVHMYSISVTLPPCID